MNLMNVLYTLKRINMIESKINPFIPRELIMMNLSIIKSNQSNMTLLVHVSVLYIRKKKITIKKMWSDPTLIADI